MLLLLSLTASSVSAADQSQQLLAAVIQGREQSVQNLLALGANADAKNPAGRPALVFRHFAGRLASAEQVEGIRGLQRFLAVAVTIQQQSGGNLAEILDGLAKVIRSRFKLFRRVKAITAEGEGEVPADLLQRDGGGVAGQQGKRSTDPVKFLKDLLFELQLFEYRFGAANMIIISVTDDQLIDMSVPPVHEKRCHHRCAGT